MEAAPRLQLLLVMGAMVVVVVVARAEQGEGGVLIQFFVFFLDRTAFGTVYGYICIFNSETERGGIYKIKYKNQHEMGGVSGKSIINK